MFLYWTYMNQITAPIKFLIFKRAPPSQESTFEGAPRALFRKKMVISPKWYKIELILGIPYNKESSRLWINDLLPLLMEGYFCINFTTYKQITISPLHTMYILKDVYRSKVKRYGKYDISWKKLWSATTKPADCRGL